MKNIKGKPLNVRVPQGIKPNDWENFQKIFNNEMAYYENNWPYNHPYTLWQKFFSLFWNLKLARRMLGGRWVKSETIWLSINDNFPDEWLEKWPHENWDE